VDAWTFIWLMVILKVPVVALLMLVRWAVREPPENDISHDEDGGIGFRASDQRHPHHPRPRLPRSPRRGPHHGAPRPSSPARTRTTVARGRFAQR
jgi:hypothetical protein